MAMRSASPGSSRLPKLTVRNTFLEFKEDSGDEFLDQDNQWGRALTEPVKVHPHSDERTPNRGGLNGFGGMDASMDPKYIFSVPGPALPGHAWQDRSDTLWRGGAGRPQELHHEVQDSLKSLACDPDLSQIFDDIRLNGVKALMKYYHDERLMRWISQKGDGFLLDGLRQTGFDPSKIQNMDFSTPTPKSCYDSALPTDSSSGSNLINPDKAGRKQKAASQRAAPGKPAHNAALDLPATFPDVGRITQAVATMDEATIENATVQAIRDMTCSVTLADPGRPDCPLIGCSAGFEALTGYTRAEVIGRNCRFLNRGNRLDPGLRRTLQQAVQNGTEFIGILPNTKKNGEVFKNLLHLTALKVRGRRYMIGVQANVDNIMLDLRNPRHLSELESVATRIFAGNVDAWVQMEEREFALRLPATCSDVMKMKAPKQYAAAQSQFVNYSIEQDAVSPAHMQGATEDGQLDPSMATASTVEGTGENEHWESRQTTPEVGEGGLKSIGSKGHPDACGSECIFYFFRGACRAGIDCQFCHEYHPRKNPKKNRRVMRRILATQSGEDGQAGDPSMQGEDAADLAEEAELAPEPRGKQLPLSSESFTPDATSPSNTQAMTSKSSGGPVTPKADLADAGGKFVSFGYGGGSASSSAQVLLAAGQSVELSPQVSLQEDSDVLRRSLEFSVEPALPTGLELDPLSGRIHGSTSMVQAPTTCTITVSTCAVGPQGIPLGRVPLNSCSLTISVVDLRNFRLAWGAQQDGHRIVLEYEQAAQ
mmetsp:Transcript_63074/g.150324  ORF Transcript_63074/g.150324 Transcript_63074/m.150324 type:complete len:765 (-) Transcript_63074:105-2399(-)|eukprot:CAMPEP_0178426228 /NCGR_PEP_ID=MMETSP0689_2-20121128/29129_1 /TAXON_ID=160604 /ORGANISM="Amphidinium massartii, Strain CS-259" /LENGTH=764 /DNA_ID=CAMNT_0020047913 /DNA_START=80 /DNA_END=2374 /DNA_ORIENTATION=-